MKYATILRYYPMYSETFVYRELAELRRRGFPLEVLTMRERPGARFLPQAALGGPREPLPRRPLYWPILKGAWELYRQRPARVSAALRWGVRHLRLKDCVKALWMARWCLIHHIDGLHIHFAGEGAEVAEIIRRVVDIPFSMTLHARDLFVPRVSLPDLLESAHTIVCISEFNRQYLRRHHGDFTADRAQVVRLGVPLVDRVAPVQADPSRFLLLAVSRLVEKRAWPT